MARIKITLGEPITHNGVTVAEVEVRTPKVREVREIEKIGTGASSVDEAVKVALLLTDLSAEQIEELDTADLFKIAEAITGFFDKGSARAIGAK